MHSHSKLPVHPLKNLKYDFPAGVVVFLVAIPLCLGIAMASGAPPLSGLISGIVGGLLVTLFSGSALSVSGPAAGLVVVVVAAIEGIGFDGLLMATVLAGCMQILFGYLKLGRIGAFVPTSVIKGMLAAIGLILVLNQLPMLVGIGSNEDVSSFSLFADQFSARALILALLALAILLIWERPVIKHSAIGKVPAPLLAVMAAVVVDRLLPGSIVPSLLADQRIGLPLDKLGIGGVGEFVAQLKMPDLSTLLEPKVYGVAITIALIASLESLLSLEAVDKIDPLERHSPPHRELKAQGVGNLVSGLVGGLPITAVIVRSSANVQAGGRTRTASFVHGLLLLVSVALLAPLLEVIPLACLAAILIQTGYKLAKPELFVEQYRKGLNRLIPFLVTLAGVVMMDLIKGVILGVFVGLCFMVIANYRHAVSFTKKDRNVLLRFRSDITFLNREEVRSCLDDIKPGDYVIIDGSQAKHIDPDIHDDIVAFTLNAPERAISIELDRVGNLTATYPANPDRLRELNEHEKQMRVGPTAHPQAT